MPINRYKKGNRKKVAPAFINLNEYKMVEVRKKIIRVQHYNQYSATDNFQEVTQDFEDDRTANISQRDTMNKNSGTKENCSPSKLSYSDEKDLIKQNLINDSFQSHSNVTMEIPKNSSNMGQYFMKEGMRKDSLKPNDMSSCDVSNYTTCTTCSDDFSKPVLFFIHGVGGSSDVWKFQIDYFRREGYEIVAPDLIGHGFSRAPKKPFAYQFSEIVSDVEDLFDTFCKRKSIIVAHSYGCSFAAVLARKKPRRISKLILISGGGPIPLYPQTSIFSLPVCCLSCFMPCVKHSFKSNAFNNKVHCSEDTDLSLPTHVLSYTMNGQYWPEGDEMYHNWITVPTLLVYGTNDRLVDITEELYMARTIYDSKLEIVQNAGHMVMVEAADKVNELMHNFLLDVDITENVCDEDTVSIVSSPSRKKKERLSSLSDNTSPRERNVSCTSQRKSVKSAKKTQGPLRMHSCSDT